ncbi:MAG: efflux RND transporter periplasmic adaptor subunit [Prolixibacteraceae bacterium]|jgi:membrane fusion protein (multidrug efflux system)|nr:efflux RND transporter periplasmic adaptor subunit [Prolixibacteraceae bacterium]
MKLRLFIISIATLAVLAGCQNQQSTQSADVSVPVRVADVVKKSIYNTLIVNGTVKPEGSIELSTEAEGKYHLASNPRTSKTFKMGDRVIKGETIIKLDNKEYELSVRLESKKLNLENARQEYEKQQSLYDKGGVTMRELQNSELSYINAKLDYENADLQIDKLKVNVPFSGVIVNLPYFTPGVKVSSGTMVVEVMNYNSLIMEASFPEKFITTIETGQDAFVTNYNLKDDTLHAEITELSPAINETTRTFKGILEIDNPELKMRPGMFVKAEVIVERRDSSIVIDRDLIQRKRRGNVVYVVERNTAIEKPVNTGIETDDEVEILSGLNVGEKIVIEGYEMLSNRTKVKVQR